MITASSARRSAREAGKSLALPLMKNGGNFGAGALFGKAAMMASTTGVRVRAVVKLVLSDGPLFWYHATMAKSIIASKKSRGRPSTGVGTPIQVRLQPSSLSALDTWRKKQTDLPSRPEAIRRLLEAALQGK